MGITFNPIPLKFLSYTIFCASLDFITWKQTTGYLIHSGLSATGESVAAGDGAVVQKAWECVCLSLVLKKRSSSVLRLMSFDSVFSGKKPTY